MNHAVRTGIAKVQEQAIHWGAQQERSRCLIQRCQPSLQLVDRRAAQLSEVFLLQPTIQLCAAQEGVSVAVLDNHSPNAADARIILVQRGDSTRHCADQPPGSGRSPSPTVAGIPMTTGPPGPSRTPGSPPESVSNAFQVHARIRYPHCYRRRHLALVRNATARHSTLHGRLLDSCGHLLQPRFLLRPECRRPLVHPLVGLHVHVRRPKSSHKLKFMNYIVSQTQVSIYRLTA